MTLLLESGTLVNIFFDEYGNLFLESLNDVYQLEVDGKNVLYLEKCKSQIMDQINKKFGTIDYHDSESDDEREDEVIDEQQYKIYGEVMKFKYYGESIRICEVKQDNVPALYDCYLYKKGYDSPYFVSKSGDGFSIFDIKIHSNGNFVLNPKSSPEKIYKLTINTDNELSFTNKLFTTLTNLII